MAAALALLPFTSLIALPPVAVAAAVALAVALAAPGLGEPLVRAGLIRAPEIVTVVTTAMAIVVAGGVAWAGLARGAGGGVAARLAAAPWRARQAAAKAGDAICPLTGARRGGETLTGRGGAGQRARGRPLPPAPVQAAGRPNAAPRARPASRPPPGTPATSWPGGARGRARCCGRRRRRR